MKKIIATLFLAGIFALPAMGQNQQERSPEQKATKMTEKMAENLDLTADQKEAAYKANLEMARSMKEDRAEAHKAHQAKMKEILTDEQYAKMEQMQKERRKEMKHRRMDSELKPSQQAVDSDQLREVK